MGECKKITISPFQTGQVIITGARTMEQIMEAYEYIKGIFTVEQETVLRKVYSIPGAPTDLTAPAEAPVKRGSSKGGWIQHPCPRNIVSFSSTALQ